MTDLLTFLRTMGEGFAVLAVIASVPLMAFLVWAVLPWRLRGLTLRRMTERGDRGQRHERQ